MFIKVTTSRGRRYAQLVESFRNEAGQPRQRTIATLGALEPGGQVDRLIAALRRAQGHHDAADGADGSADSSPVAPSACRSHPGREAGSSPQPDPATEPRKAQA